MAWGFLTEDIHGLRTNASAGQNYGAVVVDAQPLDNRVQRMRARGVVGPPEGIPRSRTRTQ